MHTSILLSRGESFRKSFKEIGGLRALIEAPFMALTASAPPSIEAKIISSLYLSSPVVVSCDLNRPNIFLSVSQIKAMSVSLMIVLLSGYIN